jgi:SPP1 gp7 family putative phage head morphogenesis protein
MGLFDFMTKAQDKLNALQKGIEDYQKRIEENPTDIFPKKHKAEPKEKQTKRKKAVPVAPSAESQIFALRDSMIKNGFREYEFISNKNCCQICAKLNGKHFPVSQLKIGVNAPPMHEGCSCSISAYTDREEYEKWLNSL